MLDTVKDFFSTASSIDIIYIVITIFSVIGGYRKGFVLSILSMAKWLLAYIITLIIFPRVKPYLEDIIDNEYVLDIGLGKRYMISDNVELNPGLSYNTDMEAIGLVIGFAIKL